ncbi:MAG: tRNA(Ile)-lysidine synthase [Chroococcopsis gigantea SAG 12.99]|jgi:tRNA(Ile)-lysidine synthase|nr:tRNA lysidine(34) synthetase TilS [Chlorogloea purpurea SAG 13.99]MDV3001345.1 tRNA(Ile)-lysidine synthase [Chroococcopsis gigantea SAG 12.99]
MWTDLHSRLSRTLKTRQLLPPHSRLLVAVSGGQDSLCLLRLLLDLQPKWDWYIVVGHGDHGWPHDRGVSDHVRNITESWGVPFRVRNAIDLPRTEAAARKWRYEVLGEMVAEEGLDTIVTGHTLSDRAETFLYNLMRGAGGDGLASLTQERLLENNQKAGFIRLVRPLLNVRRLETARFCETLNIPVWTDEYNQDLDYARNRIRLQLMPYLRDNFNPQVEKHLAQTAEILEEENKYLEQVAREYLRELVDTTGKEIDRRGLKKLPLPLQRRVIKQFLTYHWGKTANYREIELIINLIDAGNRSSSPSLRGDSIAIVRDDRIVLS